MLHTPKEKDEMLEFLLLLKKQGGNINAENYENQPIYEKAKALKYAKYCYPEQVIEITDAGVKFLERYDEVKVLKKRYTTTTIIAITALTVSLINLLISLLRFFH